MSTNQFDFYGQQKKSGIHKLSEKPQYRNPETVKTKILEAYDKYQMLQKTDLKLKELVSEEQYISNMILKSVNELQKMEREKTQENTNDYQNRIETINDRLNKLDREDSDLKKRKSQYLERQFEWISSNFPDIFNMIIGQNPPDRTTLVSVLMAFLQSEQGGVDKRQVVKGSLEELRKQHGLPEDFSTTVN